MYCSPASKGAGKNGSSCYSRDQLLHIANSYNKKYGTTIDTKGTKEQLWNQIESHMNDQCDTEWCWLKQLGIKDNGSFRPVRPVGKTAWLGTSDIRNVLKQYEQIYPDFIFLGPVPMDFCQLAGNEVCNINLKSCKRNGKTKIGIVFNTDPSNKPGQHWISMFIDISNSDPRRHEIGYFDSYGMAPLSPEIRSLVKAIKAQNPHIKLKLNCGDEMCAGSIRHQMQNSECGVYSISFIVARLTGQSWEDIVLRNRWTDQDMVDKRKHFFRPHTGPRHKY